MLSLFSFNVTNQFWWLNQINQNRNSHLLIFPYDFSKGNSVFNGCLLSTYSQLWEKKSDCLIGRGVYISILSFFIFGRSYMYLCILIGYKVISRTYLIIFLELLDWKDYVLVLENIKMSDVYRWNPLKHPKVVTLLKMA